MELIRSLLSIIFLFSIYIIFIIKKEKKKKMVYVIIAFTFMRFIFALVRYNWGLPPNLPDEIFFETNIYKVATGINISGRFDVVNYIYTQGFIRSILGNSWLVSIFINSVIGSIAIIYMKDIFIYILDGIVVDISEKKKIRMLIILFLEPTMLLYMNTLLRESIVIFLVVMAINILLKYLKKRDMRLFIIYFFLCLVLGLFRSVNMLVLILAGIGVVAVQEFKFNIKNIIFLCVAIIIISICLEILKSKLNLSIDIKYINENLNRDKLGVETMPYLIGERYENWLDLIVNIPKRLYYFILYPFPWTTASYKHIIPVISSVINLVCILLVMHNWKYILSERKNNIVILLKVFVLIMIFYAVAKSESATRHRIQFIWILLIITNALLIVKKYLNDKRNMRREK